DLRERFGGRAVDRAAENLLQRRPRGLDTALQLLEDDLRLLLQGRVHDLARLEVEWRQPRDVDRVAVTDHHRGRCLPSLQERGQRLHADDLSLHGLPPSGLEFAGWKEDGHGDTSLVSAPAEVSTPPGGDADEGDFQLQRLRTEPTEDGAEHL